jgi:hypothetical protein
MEHPKPKDALAELADRILAARHGAGESDAAVAWKKKIAKRIKDIEAGKVKGIPVEESPARVRKIAGL